MTKTNSATRTVLKRLTKLTRAQKLGKRTIVVVDLYCGAGGTSTGAQEAMNELRRRHPKRDLDIKIIAVNHWDKAIASHKLNHPDQDGRCCDIRSIDPADIVAEYGQVDVLCASPECTYHSHARGGRPFQNQSRISPFLLVEWTEVLRPKQIIIENVHEFRKWGPLREIGTALNRETGKVEPVYERIKERAGEKYVAFTESLRDLGYDINDNVYTCADFGDPTTRKRLFMRGVRLDGRDIAAWWPKQTHSKDGLDKLGGETFLKWRTSRECIDLTRRGNSMINRRDQLVVASWGRVWQGFRQDLATKGYELTGVTMPDCSKHAQPTDLPEVDEAVVGAAGDFLKDIAFTLPQDGRAKPRPIDKPLSTVATAGAISVVQPRVVTDPFIIASNGERQGQLPRTRSIDRPMPTVAATGRVQMVAPKLQAFVTIKRKHGGARTLDEPLATITAGGNHHDICKPFLISYYGTGHAHSLDAPLPTQTTKSRFALVTIRCTRTNAEDGFLLDFDHRMLWPDELAKGQGFPEGYQFAGNKTEQVKQIGNAVPVNTAKALCLAAFEQILDDEEKENQ